MTARLNVGVVGAGRVGAVLGASLRAAEHTVIGASGRSADSASRIDTLLPDVPHLHPAEFAADADLVLLTVPDDAIADVAGELVDCWRPGQLVMHASGRFGVGVLESASSRGALPLAIHPAMTFTGTSLDTIRMRDAIFAVTAAATVIPVAQALVAEFGGTAVEVAEGDRAKYHAALAHAANHAVALNAQAMEVLAQIGIDHPGRVLDPLVKASLEGAWRDGADSAASLTGPVVRGDVGTLRAHLAALSGNPEIAESYAAAAIATARVARARGRLSAEEYAEVMSAVEKDV